MLCARAKRTPKTVKIAYMTPEINTAKNPRLSRTSVTPVISASPTTPSSVETTHTLVGFPVPIIQPSSPAKNGAVANAPNVPIATPMRAAPKKNET